MSTHSVLFIKFLSVHYEVSIAMATPKHILYSVCVSRHLYAYVHNYHIRGCNLSIKGFVIQKSRVFFQRRQWHPTPVLLPGKFHGRKSLVGCSPWGRGESDTTERLHFHFSLSCIGEGNGNPLVFVPGESHGREPGGLLSMGSHRVRHG